MINANTKANADVILKLTGFSKSDIDFERIKVDVSCMVNKILNEFAKYNFKDELKKINSQNTFIQIFSKRKFKNKKILFFDLFTDDVMKVFLELQTNSGGEISSFVDTKKGISDYEKHLFHTFNTVIFYDIDYMGRLITRPNTGTTIALFNVASIFSHFFESLKDIEIKLDFKEDEYFPALYCLEVTNKEEIFEKISEMVEKFTKNFLEKNLKEILLGGIEFANQCAIKLAPSEFIAINCGYTFEEDFLSEDDSSILNKIDGFNHILFYPHKLTCFYHNDFRYEAEKFYCSLRGSSYKREEIVTAFQTVWELEPKRVEHIFDFFKDNVSKLCPSLSDWVNNLTLNKKSEEPNVKVLDEDYFNLF